MSCCDVYGNAGGDWVDCIADQATASGNLSEEPLFCDDEGGDYRLSSESSCLVPSLDPSCDDYLGAWAVGCGTAGIPVNELKSPQALELAPVMPNPSKPGVKIEYTIPADTGGSHVSLKMYDTLGRLVCTLMDDSKTSGSGTISWDGADSRGNPVASGVYFCRLEWNGRSATRRIVLVH